MSGPTKGDSREIQQGAETESTGSITSWIEAIKSGDGDAAGLLWNRYFQRLVDMARTKFPVVRSAGAIADEEDAALSAMGAVCTGLVQGRYPNLSDRGDLWCLLVTITARKAINQTERWGRVKRGGGLLIRESDLESTSEDRQGGGLNSLIGNEPTPEFIAMMAEEYQIILDLLQSDPELQLSEIATWKLQGFTEKEIAEKLDCSKRTVAGRMSLIRKTLESRLIPKTPESRM